jgi:hypothetical protein
MFDRPHEVLRDARENLETAQAVWMAAKRRHAWLTKLAERSANKWGGDLMRGTGNAMSNWDRAEAAERIRDEFELDVDRHFRELKSAAAYGRQVIASLSAKYRPIIIGLNQRGPELYQLGVQTGNWAPYREFRLYADGVSREIKDVGLTVRIIMNS